MKKIGLTISAALFPLVTVLFVGTRQDWIVNAFLTAAFYVPGSVHAVRVVNRGKAAENGPGSTIAFAMLAVILMGLAAIAAGGWLISRDMEW